MSQEINQWGSHLPALIAAVTNTDGPIVECGTGENSTPALHDLSAYWGRPLYSYESDAAWFSRFKGKGGDLHRLSLIADWANLPIPDGCGVVFVDHGKAPRGPVVDLARDKCRIVVMHDSECHYCGYTEPLAKFDWVYTHKNCAAWTTLAGMGQPPAWLESLKPGEFGIPVPYRG